MNRLKLILNFIAGTLISLFTWNYISLESNNPLEIVSLVSELNFNPASNLFRFCLVLLIPTTLIVILNGFFPSLFSQLKPAASKVNGTPSYKAEILFIVCFALLATLIPTFLSWGAFDWFHEGDALAAAEGVRQGMTAYKDIWFVHGLYQDVYRILFASNWLEPSIEAARSLESVHKIISYCLLALMLIEIFKRDSIKYWIAGTVLFALHSSTYLPPIAVIPREIIPYLFLILILSKNQNKFSLLLVGFLPWLGILYALDRGVYCFVLLGAWLIFSLISKKQNFKSLSLALLGFIAGFAFLIFTLGEGTKSFFLTLIEMPKYHDLIMGLPYPITDTKYLLAVVLLSGALYWLACRYLSVRASSENKALTNFIDSYFTELIIFTAAVLWFRNTLNRPDKVHLEYSMLFTYLFWICVLLKYYLSALLKKEIKTICIAALSMVSCFAVINLISTRGLRQNFPFFYSSSSSLLGDYDQSGEILETVGKDKIFVYSADSTWYYTLSKAPVSGYSQAWFAATNTMQNKLIENLKDHKVQWIIKDCRGKRFQIDGINLDKRLPKIHRHISENYSLYKKLGEIEMLKLNLR
ncbi:MAG: hypothetical protein R3A13_02195 [Bdellovibrionota bacterium]